MRWTLEVFHASGPLRGGKKDCVLLFPGCQFQPYDCKPFHYSVSLVCLTCLDAGSPKHRS